MRHIALCVSSIGDVRNSLNDINPFVSHSLAFYRIFCGKEAPCPILMEITGTKI